MNRFSLKTMLIGFLALTSFLLSVSPALANCDGWAADGAEHRNAGNGCTYRCAGSSWSGPVRCDGQGNGQFQGEAARTAEERERQARAVAERNNEARAQVERQGAAETARIAASTAEQRAVEATRQQAMVENQRQQEVSLAARFGASAQEIAAINTRAREAATFVSQAQGTDRGANLVGSNSQNTADIAARGYEATSSLATGVTVVNTSSQASVGGGSSGGGDVAAAALYTGPGQCNILAETDGKVVPGGKCCRGGNVECASGTCSAGSIGQEGVCSGGDATTGPSTSTVVSVAFRSSTGQVTSLPVVSSPSDCVRTTGTRSCAYQGRFVCVNDATYSDRAGGCSKWERDMVAQSNRGSSEAVLQSPSSCGEGTRGCLYAGGWVCVDKNAYPETSASTDSSRGCAAWQRDFSRTQNSGRMTHKLANGVCMLCAASDDATVCRYSSEQSCKDAQAVARSLSSQSSPQRYRLLSGQGTSCLPCTTVQDAERYDCRFTNASCDGQASVSTTVEPGQLCNATPGIKCFCSTTSTLIERQTTCPSANAAAELRNLRPCEAVSGATGVITTRAGLGNDRVACLKNGIKVYRCITGDCNASSAVPANNSVRTDGPTVGDDLSVTRGTNAQNTVDPVVRETVTYVDKNGTTVNEQVVTSASQCRSDQRGCRYNNGWVCVSKQQYPERPLSASDTSNGCSAWNSSRVTTTSPQGNTVPMASTTGLTESQVITCQIAACKSPRCVVNRDQIPAFNSCVEAARTRGQADGPDTVAPVDATQTAPADRTLSCNRQVCNADSCTGLTQAEQTRLAGCISSTDGVAPRIGSGTCSQAHSQRIPGEDNKYCCNGSIVNKVCDSAIDSSRAGNNLPDGTWCNNAWWTGSSNTCVKCANGFHAGENGRDYCGQDPNAPVAPVSSTPIPGGRCMLPHGRSTTTSAQAIFYCCNGTYQSTACPNAVDISKSGSNLPDGTWCTDAFYSHTCNNCAHGSFYQNGRHYCGTPESVAAISSAPANAQSFCADKADNVADNTNTASNGRFRYKCCGGVSVIETTTCSGVSGIPSQTQSPSLSQRTVANNFCAGGSVENNQPVTIGRATNTDFKCCNGSAILRTETCTSTSANNTAAPVTVNGLNEEQVNVCERAACGNPDCVRDTPTEIQTYNNCIRSSAILAQAPAPLRDEGGCMARACGYSRCSISNEGQRQVYVACMGGDSYETRITSCNNQLCGSPYCNNLDSSGRTRIQSCINTGTLPPVTQPTNIETRTEFCSTRGNNVPITGSTQQKCCNGRAVNNDVQCAVVIETDGEVSSDTLGVSTLDIAQNNTACGGSLQTPCDISAQGQSWRTCDRGYLIDYSISGGMCRLDVRAISNNRSDCGGNLEPSCAVVSENNRTVQSCDTGSLYNANINLCVPALYSGVPACSAGTLYDSQTLTNLTACYSGSGTNRSLKYFCPPGISCTQRGQTIGVNGCSLQSSRPNAVSCGFTTEGKEVFRCEHGPGRQENGVGNFVCPSVNGVSGQLVYQYPASNQTVTQPSFNSLFCQNRGNGSYTDNGYPYNCCNSVNIPQGQQCVAAASNNQVLLCPETGCAVTPQIAVASDAVVANQSQRWSCLISTNNVPVACRACDGTSPVVQVTCSSLQDADPVGGDTVRQFNSLNDMRSEYQNANPQLRE